MFCSLDLASSQRVSDGVVTKLYGDGLLEAKDIVREVAEDIRLAIEAKSNVTGLATTFPAVLSKTRSHSCAVH